MANCKYCKAKGAELKINLHSFCDFDCAVSYSKNAAKTAQDKARAKKQAEARRMDRQKLEKLKTRSEWLKDLQSVFNKFIRLRDAGNPCISCGRHHQGRYHAGHYLSVGAHPELRFHPENCFLQCQPCNTHLSGNLINYRRNLINKIGIDRVEWLEGKHDPLKLTVEEIKSEIARCRAKIKEIEKSKNTC